MSDRNPRINYSNPAREDLEDISIYGIKQWGEARAHSYLSDLYAAIELLADHPELGVECTGFRSQTRKLAVREHLVYYRPIGKHILVLRVVHQRMDSRHMFWTSRLRD